MLDPIINLFSSALQFLYELTGNYGWAIIILTVVIKVLLLPLNLSQMRSMRKMQEMTPLRKQIEQKYKGDPQKMQQAMMEMYKEQGINPMAGCLPTLVQFPILIALFYTFRDPAHYGGVTPMFMGLNLLWPNPAEGQTWQVLGYGYLVLPVLTALTTYLQTLVSTPPGTVEGPQRTMLYVMPLLLGWMSLQFPSGVSLYYTLQNVIGIGQALLVARGTQSAQPGRG